MKVSRCKADHNLATGTYKVLQCSPSRFYSACAMLVPVDHEVMLSDLVGGGGLRIILLPSILL